MHFTLTLLSPSLKTLPLHNIQELLLHTWGFSTFLPAALKHTAEEHITLPHVELQPPQGANQLHYGATQPHCYGAAQVHLGANETPTTPIGLLWGYLEFSHPCGATLKLSSPCKAAQAKDGGWDLV